MDAKKICGMAETMLNLNEASIIQHLIEMKMAEILSEGGRIYDTETIYLS